MAKKRNNRKKFHIDFKNSTQKMAWASFQQHDVVFFKGTPGSGKTHLAMAFAISEILQNNKKNIYLTRPIVEAGEKLGYLPGEFEEKVAPYMMPLYNCLDRMIEDDVQKQQILDSSKILPLAFMRGFTFNNAICIFDEAQNATFSQLKLFLTRMGENCKLIITGDPDQSDIENSGMVDIIFRLQTLQGIGIVEFDDEAIVRHSLVKDILKKLNEK